MKSIFKAALVAFLFSLMAACSISDSGLPLEDIDATTSEDECEASGSEFCSIDESSVQLELFIQTPSSSLIPDSSVGNCAGQSHDKDTASALNRFTYCFDISGTCNEAGLESAVVVARTSLDGFAASNIVGTCRRGRFHVQVQQLMTSCADHANKIFDINHNFCQQHQIQLELVGKKADGTEVRNQARAVKTINFIVSNRPECDGSAANTFTLNCS